MINLYMSVVKKKPTDYFFVSDRLPACKGSRAVAAVSLTSSSRAKYSSCSILFDKTPNDESGRKAVHKDCCCIL